MVRVLIIFSLKVDLTQICIINTCRRLMIAWNWVHKTWLKSEKTQPHMGGVEMLCTSVHMVPVTQCKLNHIGLLRNNLYEIASYHCRGWRCNWILETERSKRCCLELQTFSAIHGPVSGLVGLWRAVTCNHGNRTTLQIYRCLCVQLHNSYFGGAHGFRG
jgi:hypothetical protein